MGSSCDSDIVMGSVKLFGCQTICRGPQVPNILTGQICESRMFIEPSGQQCEFTLWRDSGWDADADACWLGYADDLIVMSTGELGAQQALMQLQAACAFVGLQINVAMTKCMGASGGQGHGPQSLLS